MKSLSRHAFAHTAPVIHVVSWMVRRHAFPGVAVLCYHGVRPDALPGGLMAFEELHVRSSSLECHLDAVRACCHPISLHDWRRHLAEGTPLPARPVLVTFDDGYRSVRTHALPLLERFEVPAVVFVSTRPIVRRERLWYDAASLTARPEVVDRLKTLTYPEWRASVDELDLAIDGDDDPHAPLTVDDVAHLAAHPLIEIGGHTHAHPILSHLPDADQRREIDECASLLLQWTGRPMRAFAYPNGRGGVDFTRRTMQLLQLAGVDHAFCTDHGFAPSDGDPRVHPRFTMTAGVTASHLLHRLAHGWQ
jgi:peptidoglycan/xylan/chitin deacetylase (PgdA/CDA1 family)